MSNPNCVSLTETLELTPVASMRSRTRRYSRTSVSASRLDVVLSPRWSNVAVTPAWLSSRMAAIASSMFSPAMKRRVTCLNPGNFEKKSFSSCFCERYKRAALEIISPSIFIKIIQFTNCQYQSGISPDGLYHTTSSLHQPAFLDGDQSSQLTNREPWCYHLRRNIPERKTTARYTDGYTFNDCPDALPGWRVLFNLHIRHEIQSRGGACPQAGAHHRTGVCGAQRRHGDGLARSRLFPGGQSERGQRVHRLGDRRLLPGDEPSLPNARVAGVHPSAGLPVHARIDADA